METESQSNPLSRSAAYLRVLGILAILCRRDFLRILFSAGGRLVVFLVLSLVVRCLLDYWLHFGRGARAAFLLADLVVIGWLMRRCFWGPFKHRLSTNTAALRLQRFAPGLRSRIIATIQLVPEVESGRASRSLVENLLKDTVMELEKVEWKRAVPLKSAIRWVLVAGFLAIGAATWAIAHQEKSVIQVGRYFLSGHAPILKTRLEVVSGDLKLPSGSDARLLATTGGEVPGEAVFRLTSPDGGEETFTVNAKEDRPGEFELIVENAQDGFRYQVFAGDAESATFDVDVLEPPRLREIVIRVDPPSYTGLSSYVVPANEIRIVEGSRVTVEGQTSDALDSGWVYLIRSDSSSDELDASDAVPFTLDSDRKGVSAGIDELPVEVGYFMPVLLGENGVESVDNTRHPIQWVLDAEPEIRLTKGAANLDTVVPGRSVRIAGAVEEDYGLSSVEFCFQVSGGGAPDAEEKVERVLLNTDEGAFEFELAFGGSGASDAVQVPAESGDEVTWWIEAVDNSELEDGPHRVESPREVIRVVTPEEKISELMGRVREGMSVIEDVSGRQDETAKKLKELIDQREDVDQ